MPDPPEPPVIVPHRELSPAALQGVIESFVLREGTDYGEHEVPLQRKVEQIRAQLERGEASVLYDPGSNSVHIVPVPTGRTG